MSTFHENFTKEENHLISCLVGAILKYKKVSFRSIIARKSKIKTLSTAKWVVQEIKKLTEEAERAIEEATNYDERDDFF